MPQARANRLRRRAHRACLREAKCALSTTGSAKQAAIDIALDDFVDARMHRIVEMFRPQEERRRARSSHCLAGSRQAEIARPRDYAARRRACELAPAIGTAACDRPAFLSPLCRSAERCTPCEGARIEHQFRCDCHEARTPRPQLSRCELRALICTVAKQCLLIVRTQETFDLAWPVKQACS